MHTGSRLANDMWPPSIGQYDILCADVASLFAPRQAPSNRPPSVVQSLAPSSYHDHVGGGSAPNSSGPVQHLGTPATPLKPEIILGSPPPAPFLHPPSARALQTPSSYPIWYPTCIDRLLSKFRNLCTAYLSNLLSGKAHVDYPRRPPSSQVIPAPPTPSAPAMRQF